MGRTWIRQDVQIGSTTDTTAGYTDNTAPSLAAYETNASTITDDLNNLRSSVHNLLKLRTGNWYDDISTPSTFEGGAQRGVDTINQDLHDYERKRVLRSVLNLTDVGALGSVQHVVLALGELPANTTAAIGAVTTLGTVAASATTFGTASATDVVAGTTAVQPKNMVEIVDGATRDPIIDSGGERVWGLFQTESTTDGSTMTGTTPNRAQISFVTLNATGDGLQLVTAADMNGKTINYASVERKAMEDLNEQDFLRGAATDIGAGSATIDRQNAYDNQGITPVDVTTNAILDLESAGLQWIIRDDAEANLFRIVEGSAGSTSEVEIGSDVDLYDNDAADVDFDQGISVNTGQTRPIDVGITDGVIETTAGDFMVKSAAELLFDDLNQTGSTWAQDGIKLSETTAEWDAFEAAFGGEVSLLNAIVQAHDEQVRTKVQATLTANVAANNDVNGPGTAHNNTDVDLAPYDTVPTSFVADVDVYLNGELLRNAAAAGSEDVYPGGTPADGDLAFTFALKGTGTKPDQITMIVHGQ